MNEQIDNPGLDGTDGAHPAWWRGQDAGAIGAATKIAKAAEGGHSCEVTLANVLRVTSEIIDSASHRSAPLYTEPAWLIESRGWLVRFRAAVESAGLRWVTPEWDQDHAGDRPDFTFCAPSANSNEPHWTMWAQIDRSPGVLVAIGNEDEHAGGDTAGLCWGGWLVLPAVRLDASCACPGPKGDARPAASSEADGLAPCVDVVPGTHGGGVARRRTEATGLDSDPDRRRSCPASVVQWRIDSRPQKTNAGPGGAGVEKSRGTCAPQGPEPRRFAGARVCCFAMLAWPIYPGHRPIANWVPQLTHYPLDVTHGTVRLFSNPHLVRR